MAASPDQAAANPRHGRYTLKFRYDYNIMNRFAELFSGRIKRANSRLGHGPGTSGQLNERMNTAPVRFSKSMSEWSDWLRCLQLGTVE
jgi:hypothetical protein